jgi:hypothetical protein
VTSPLPSQFTQTDRFLGPQGRGDSPRLHWLRPAHPRNPRQGIYHRSNVAIHTNSPTLQDTKAAEVAAATDPGSDQSVFAFQAQDAPLPTFGHDYVAAATTEKKGEVEGENAQI